MWTVAASTLSSSLMLQPHFDHTCRTLFVLASTSLRPHFNHLRCTLFVLRSCFICSTRLYSHCVLPCMHAAQQFLEQLNNCGPQHIWPATHMICMQATIVQLLVKLLRCMHASTCHRLSVLRCPHGFLLSIESVIFLTLSLSRVDCTIPSTTISRAS
jgi:hypothetical protein